MTTKTVNVNGKRRARHFSGPSVTLPRLSPGEGLRSVGEEILPLERAAVGLGVAAALCGLPAVSTGDTEASNHEAGGGRFFTPALLRSDLRYRFGPIPSASQRGSPQSGVQRRESIR